MDEERVKELKVRALELKKLGDIEGCKAILAQVRELEFGNASVDDLNDPMALKKLAIVLKRKGDVEGAKEALIKAKRIQAEHDNDASERRKQLAQEVAQQQQSQQPLEEVTTTSTPQVNPTNDTSTPAPNPSPTTKVGTTEQKPDDSPGIVPGSDDDDDGSVSMGSSSSSLMEEDGEMFTEEEMCDLEMMTEFALGGMEVPSKEEYEERILQNKKMALASKKEGDLTSAKQFLLISKKLQQVMTALSHMDEGLGLRVNADEEGWIETLNEQENEMVEDMFTGGADADNQLDYDDLVDMDIDMIRDAIDAGMKIPSVDPLLQQSKQKKQQALQSKQSGDLEAAKLALLESKKLQMKADQINTILQSIHNDDHDNHDALDMEDLLQTVEHDMGGAKLTSDDKQNNKPTKTASKTIKQQQQQQQQQQPLVEPTKTAAELKAEVFRLKGENKIKEATAMLQLYKQTLAKETAAAELKKKQEIIQTIQDEISLANQQQHLFYYYERLVSTDIGTTQQQLWNKYISTCQNATQLIDTHGSDYFTMERTKTNMLQIQGDITDIIKEGTNPTDPSLEVTLIKITSIEENKHYARDLRRKQKEEPKSSDDSNDNHSHTKEPPTLRVEVAIQLPKREENTDEIIHMNFVPTSVVQKEDKEKKKNGYQFQFGSSQTVELPRGQSKHAKMIVRRLPRKRIVLSVFQTYAPKVLKEESWFRSAKVEAPPPPLFLGKVIFDCKDFLTTNHIGGNVPLMDSTGHRPVGGQIAFGIRTGVPFDPDSFLEDDTTLNISNYSHLSFSPKS